MCNQITNCTDNCNSCLEEEIISTDIWYNPKATDEEIAHCKGDYIGCEICCNVGRCFDMLLKKLDNAIRKEEEALPEDVKAEYYASLQEETKC
jgi:hypothetical protein